MKTIKIAIAMLCILSIEAKAQKTDSLKNDRKQYLTEHLKLSSDQSKKVTGIEDQYKEQLNKIVGLKLTDPEKRARFLQLVDEKNKKLTEVLSEDQLKQLLPTTELDRLKKSIKK